MGFATFTPRSIAISVLISVVDLSLRKDKYYRQKFEAEPTIICVGFWNFIQQEHLSVKTCNSNSMN